MIRFSLVVAERGILLIRWKGVLIKFCSHVQVTVAVCLAVALTTTGADIFNLDADLPIR